jgi:hypothetical protein
VAKRFAKYFGGFTSDHRMRFGSEFWRRRFSRANGPHRLIRHHQIGGFLCGDSMESAHALAAETRRR